METFLEGLARLKSLPGTEDDSDLRVLPELISPAMKSPVVTGCSPRIMAAAVLWACGGSQGHAPPWIVSARAPALRELWDWLMLYRDLNRPLFFHGKLADFNRDVGISSDLLVVGEQGGRVELQTLNLARLAQPGARVLAAPSVSERDWLSVGTSQYFTAQKPATLNTRWRVMTATDKCFGIQCGLDRAALDPLREQLERRYFLFGDLRDASYTPAATETARIHRSLDDIPQKRRSGWPFEPVIQRITPDSVPDGRPWPRISVVTPSYNQGRFLEQTILSVIHQRYPNVEHIIIDGGSSDETADVLKRYRPHLDYVVSEADRGQGHAINKGMRVATGSILTWLNSDDMLAPDALFGIALALATSGADLVAGVCTLIEDGKVIRHRLTCCEDGPLPLDEILDLDGAWNVGQFFQQPEVMFTRDIWERAGGSVREDLNYCMDYELWVRFAEVGARLHVIGRPVALFRLHEHQKIGATQKGQQEAEEYLSAYFAEGKQRPIYRQLPSNPKDYLRIVILNDRGYVDCPGVAHRRVAAALQFAGHYVTVMELAEPGEDANDTSLRLRRLAATVQRLGPDVIIIGKVHGTQTDQALLHRLSGIAPTFWILHDLRALTGYTCRTPEQHPPLATELIEPARQRNQQLLSAKTGPVLLTYSSSATEFAREVVRKDLSLSDLRIEQISLGLETDRFVSLPKDQARKALGLPEDSFLILVSGDWREVFAAVELLGLPGMGIVTIGTPPDEQELPLEEVYPLGSVEGQERLTMIYSAVDLVVGAGRKETLDQGFLEANACGAPVIGFTGSGAADPISIGVTGTLLDDGSVPSLAAAIREYYLSPRLCEAMGAWSRLHVENQWSLFSLYASLFRAWRRLGFIDRWELHHKARYLAAPPPLPQVQFVEQPEPGITTQDLSPPENPIPEMDLPTYRWAFGPVSRINYLSDEDAEYLLVLKYRNPHSGQHMAIRCGEVLVLERSLPTTGYSESRMLMADLSLRKGLNEIQLEFSQWNREELDPRPLALIVETVEFLSMA